MATGLPIDAIDGLARVIEGLQRDIKALKNDQGRMMSMGNTYRIEVSGNGAAAQLLAVRTADNNTKILAP